MFALVSFDLTVGSRAAPRADHHLGRRPACHLCTGMMTNRRDTIGGVVSRHFIIKNQLPVWFVTPGFQRVRVLGRILFAHFIFARSFKTVSVEECGARVCCLFEMGKESKHAC